jgi:undecaprenyl-diphosphatase
MDIQAIILGIVQGFAEWLPISSEGMNSLILVNFFDMTLAEAVPYAIWLHLGTLLAATIYFRKDILEILKGLRKHKITPDTTNFLIVATLFTGIIGGLLYAFGIAKLDINGAIATALIGILLIITGIMQKTAKKTNLNKKVTWTDAVITGIAQGFAVLPGISRSGTTYSVLLLRKYEANQALRLSFLMSIPAVAAATAGLVLLEGIFFSAGSVLAIGISFVVGYLTIGILLKAARKIDFSWFCIGLGILSFLALLV